MLSQRSGCWHIDSGITQKVIRFPSRRRVVAPGRMQATGTHRRTISAVRQWVEKHVAPASRKATMIPVRPTKTWSMANRVIVRQASRKAVSVRFILLPPMWGALQVKEKPLPAAYDALDKGLARPAGLRGLHLRVGAPPVCRRMDYRYCR
jgi:hypothetical protein